MNLKKSAIAAYLILLHLLVGIALVKTDLLPRIADRLGLAPPDMPDTEPLMAAWRAIHRHKDATAPEGATLFLGDSITKAMPVANITPGAVNFGIGWQRADQLIVSMRGYTSLQRAARVVVMIGTNDLLQGQDAALPVHYRTILAKIPRDTPVIMASVPPLAPTSKWQQGAVDDARVRAAVASAQQACEARPHCRFVNAYDALSQQGAAMPGALQPDGIHLAPLGYELLTTLIRDAMESGA
jgi:hypothetical protein